MQRVVTSSEIFARARSLRELTFLLNLILEKKPNSSNANRTFCSDLLRCIFACKTIFIFFFR